MLKLSLWSISEPELRLLAASALQVRSMPVRKDDEVSVVRGTYKGREGKVIQKLLDERECSPRLGIVVNC